jgi:hypothetical protein
VWRWRSSERASRAFGPYSAGWAPGWTVSTPSSGSSRRPAQELDIHQQAESRRWRAISASTDQALIPLTISAVARRSARMRYSTLALLAAEAVHEEAVLLGASRALN